MTTSHKPTYYPAVGGSTQGGNVASLPSARTCARDLSVTRHLKRRRSQTMEEVNEATLVSFACDKRGAEILSIDGPDTPAGGLGGLVGKSEYSSDAESDSPTPGDGDGDGDGIGDGVLRTHNSRLRESDKDAVSGGDGDGVSGDGVSGSSGSDDSESEDEEILLQRELQIIRQQRIKTEQAAHDRQTQASHDALVDRVKKQIEGENKGVVYTAWQDEAVFRGPSAFDVAAPVAQRQVNDVIRTHFHKNFLKKYIG